MKLISQLRRFFRSQFKKSRIRRSKVEEMQPSLSQADLERLQLIGERISNSTGLQIYWLLEFMSMNYYVFEVNYHDLAEYLETKSSPREWYTDVLPIIKEVLRLLHNYLASSKTLVDLTRGAMHTKLGTSDIRYEYDDRVETLFSDDPLSGFVQDLRNFLLHNKLPLAMPMPKFEFDSREEMETFSMAMTISKSQLMTWDKWTGRAQAFLIDCDDHIELNQVVESHYSQISSFHSWLHLAIRDEFEEELKHLDELDSERNSILLGKRPDA